MTEPVRFVALNIALLLDSELDALCRRLNAMPSAEPFSDFRKPDNHPHITLAMGVFREEEIPVIDKEVKSIIHYVPRIFSITELYRKTSEQIGQEYQLLIEKDKAFDDFHRAFMERIKPYITTFPASQEMFVVDADETWEPNTTYWVDGFRHKKEEEYRPHISLKCRHALLDARLPIEGKADGIIIARIGNYCSCRRIVTKVC